MDIKITVNEDISLRASLNDTETARKVYEALPIRDEGSTWGEEIYFSTEVTAPLENPRDLLEAGEIAYWPPMQAVCLFYGPTPASRGDEIRAAGPVNVIGKIEGDLSPLKGLQGTVNVVLEKA